MAKLLDPNFASQPCDRFDWWPVESNTDISKLFSSRKQKNNFFSIWKIKRNCKKNVCPKGLKYQCHWWELMVILIFINIRGKKINHKIKATKVEQNRRSSHEINLKKKLWSVTGTQWQRIALRLKILVLKIEQAHQVGPLHLHLHLQQYRCLSAS